MKRIISILLTALVVLNIGAVNVFAANGGTDTVNINDYSTDNWDRFTYNYQFESGADTKETFGVPTQTDAAARNPELENVRRNKDAALLPPSFSIFSGGIPTDASSPYHTNVKSDYAGNVTNYSQADTYNGTLAVSADYVSDTGVLASTSTMQTTQEQNYYSQTDALYYDDGSIGTIRIPSLNMTAKVYEGESVESMRKGLGHFEYTSVWNGNVCLAGHNRGSAAYLSGIWNLKNGDKIIYTTKYGQRTYEVYSKEKISDTDYSNLVWSRDNILTLITCVENQSSLRWCIQAAETK